MIVTSRNNMIDAETGNRKYLKGRESLENCCIDDRVILKRIFENIVEDVDSSRLAHNGVNEYSRCLSPSMKGFNI